MKAAHAFSPLNIRQYSHSLLWMEAFDISHCSENCPLLLCYKHGCKNLSTAIICNKKQWISTYHCCTTITLVINTGNWLSLMSLHSLLCISLPTVEISIFGDLLNGSSAIWICIKLQILRSSRLIVDFRKILPPPQTQFCRLWVCEMQTSFATWQSTAWKTFPVPFVQPADAATFAFSTYWGAWTSPPQTKEQVL